MSDKEFDRIVMAMHDDGDDGDDGDLSDGGHN